MSAFAVIFASLAKVAFIVVLASLWCRIVREGF